MVRREVRSRSTSPRPSPHFAPPTPQNAEREKGLAYNHHSSTLTNQAARHMPIPTKEQCRDTPALTKGIKIHGRILIRIRESFMSFKRTTPGRFAPNSLWKNSKRRRVRTRGLQDFLGYYKSCRPSAPTGRLFRQSAKVRFGSTDRNQPLPGKRPAHHRRKRQRCQLARHFARRPNCQP